MEEGYNRIGISGGTFDPVHNGHLIMAAAVKEKYCLDRVIFIPTGNPPHKIGMKVTEAEHRYNMLSLGVSSYSAFEVSRLEIDRIGFTYTIDTLTQLKKIYGFSARLFFITGADVIHDLLTWKEYEKVFTMCEFIAILRPGFDKEGFLNAVSNLKQKYYAKIDVFEVEQINISSTGIREKISMGQTIKNLVPENVEKYINDNNLYKSLI